MLTWCTGFLVWSGCYTPTRPWDVVSMLLDTVSKEAQFSAGTNCVSCGLVDSGRPQGPLCHGCHLSSSETLASTSTVVVRERRRTLEVMMRRPRSEVANWMRKKGCHPVIWQMVKREYQFASELHARLAAEILHFQTP